MFSGQLVVAIDAVAIAIAGLWEAIATAKCAEAATNAAKLAAASELVIVAALAVAISGCIINFSNSHDCLLGLINFTTIISVVIVSMRYYC